MLKLLEEKCFASKLMGGENLEEYDKYILNLTEPVPK